MRTPAFPSPLVTEAWLAENIAADDLVVIDATVQTVQYAFGKYGLLSGETSYADSGHIPKAVFADLLAGFSGSEGTVGLTRPDRSRFERAASALGVGNRSSVVVYDGDVGQWAMRLWWLFRSFGFDDVAVLDGGLSAWAQAGHPTVLGPSRPRRGVFIAHERPELWVGLDYVEAIVDGEIEANLVCGVPREGDEEPGALGSMPGTARITFDDLVDPSTKRLRDRVSLSERFGPLLDGRQTVAYCGGGASATADAFALTLLGERNVAVYDGSVESFGRSDWTATLL